MSLQARPSFGSLKAYLRLQAPFVDWRLFSAAQIHYTADPICDGLSDPVACRTGLRRGLVDEVKFPNVEQRPTNVRCFQSIP